MANLLISAFWQQLGSLPQMAADSTSATRKNAKVYVKKMLKYVPIMGWAWVFAEIVFLERKWEQDHLTIASQLDIIAEYPDPIWLLLFCEGTRFTPEKHAASMEVARRKGLPEFKHVLLPRTKGFLFSVEQLRGKLPAIYSCTMAFNRTEGAEPTVMSVLNGKHVVCEVYFERIPLEEVPEDEKQASKWLFDLYAKKDKLLDSYYKTGSFTKTSGYPEMPLSLMKCRIYSLLNIIFWNVLVLIPVFIFVFNIICNASSISIVITISIMILVYLAVNKMIQLTKVSHGSSYGQVTASSQSSKSGSSLPNGQPTEDKKEL
ncbi:unnamed protein product [Darwinula stevensoni]|uniref:Phospholipid/glycerol acyltransferase domain-containing protein n=1 Tax=Darwinula stevensoni TaxID=69355 RepID=A0A7R8X7Q1_9CRUS|nr:unnamed protein product [Darwinula stevensoni]CAG0888926.1 unnamed protein product [Darwinula stevensoni]